MECTNPINPTYQWFGCTKPTSQQSVYPSSCLYVGGMYQLLLSSSLLSVGPLLLQHSKCRVILLDVRASIFTRKRILNFGLFELLVMFVFVKLTLAFNSWLLFLDFCVLCLLYATSGCSSVGSLCSLVLSTAFCCQWKTLWAVFILAFLPPQYNNGFGHQYSVHGGHGQRQGHGHSRSAAASRSGAMPPTKRWREKPQGATNGQNTTMHIDLSR